jgi:hypothetical protein
MARVKIFNSLAGMVDSVSECIKIVPKVAQTFANKYKVQSKIEVAEDLQESSVTGATAIEKANNVNASCSALGWKED